ncbi:Os03g0408101 [Oryza sativa Japonica Group]|uniref:Os03g0408101 protein n=1 Tax=Oryza sativa subsp. japonica TaxID=39947 RepID=A0A0P0VYM6_ORYSJ|nr:hypothetical protein EE612_018010 [Oryza sativa]BAS84644.1 Os03g0408101 [Oryza sativa Japonica Group]
MIHTKSVDRVWMENSSGTANVKAYFINNYYQLLEVVLEAALGHVLVDEQAVLVLAAVADELHQVGVPELPKEDHLRLHASQKYY